MALLCLHHDYNPDIDTHDDSSKSSTEQYNVHCNSPLLDRRIRDQRCTNIDIIYYLDYVLFANNWFKQYFYSRRLPRSSKKSPIILYTGQVLLLNQTSIVETFTEIITIIFQVNLRGYTHMHSYIVHSNDTHMLHVQAAFTWSPHLMYSNSALTWYSYRLHSHDSLS